MSDYTWKDAIVRVLQASTEPMHYADIAEAIADQQLRADYGATPAASVNSVISKSIQDEGSSSLFIRAGRGQYWLRALSLAAIPAASLSTPAAGDETGLINAFGMYWSRSRVFWNPSAPKLLGQQQPGSNPVDFGNQKGVYLLHDGRSVVYVGRTTDQPMGMRLRQHVSDRLNGRWDRFSWFGIYPVSESGSLDTGTLHTLGVTSLIVTMEALLIEGLEPPQNRKRGDDFRAVEFLQVEDTEIQKAQIYALMDELKKKL